MPRRSPEALSRAETDTFRDLRSFKHAQNRQSRQSEKYYGYRGVDPSWVDEPYLSFSSNNPPLRYWDLHPSCAPKVSRPEDMKVSRWTKSDMWHDRESNIWPLDRRHHKGRKIREKYACKYNERGTPRRMKHRTRDLEFASEQAEMTAREDESLCIQEIQDCLFHEMLEYMNELEEFGEEECVDRDCNEEGEGHINDQDGIMKEEGDLKRQPHGGVLSENGRDPDGNDEGVDGFDFISELDFDVMSIDSFDDEYNE